MAKKPIPPAPPPPPPVDPFEGHVFAVVAGADDTEVIAATQGLRRLGTYVTGDPTVTNWVADVVALPAGSSATALRVMKADFEVQTSTYDTLSKAHAAAMDKCGFADKNGRP